MSSSLVFSKSYSDEMSCSLLKRIFQIEHPKLIQNRVQTVIASNRDNPK